MKHSEAGKGSRQRPRQISEEEWTHRWRIAFGTPVQDLDYLDELIAEGEDYCLVCGRRLDLVFTEVPEVCPRCAIMDDQDALDGLKCIKRVLEDLKDVE